MDTQYMRRRVCTVVRAVVCLLSTSLLTTCDFSGIFATIQQEVAIKSPSIPGAIYGLVKAGNKLYATNGRLWEKDLSGTGWKPVSCFDSVIGGSRITSLAADNGGNGVLVACIPGKGAYKWQHNGCQTNGSLSALSGTEKALSVVGTGTSGVYLLNHTDDQVGETNTSHRTTALGEMNEFCLHAGNGFLVTTKKVCVGGDSTVAKSDGEEPVPPILAATDDGSGHVYILTKDKVYCRYTSGSGSATTTWCDVEHKVSEPLALAVFKNEGETFLLVGGQRGYGEIKIATASGDSSSSLCVPLTAENVHATTGWDEKSSTPKDSAEQYRSTIGRWAVSGIYVIKKATSGGRKKRDTSANCERPDLYVAVGDTNDTYTGLWKFDTATNTWNRE
ncbi:hypothetical protein [Treponema paraluiscuniculi]|nr:hypothetical protein [Treponema paraluiscuniculi]